MIIEEARQSLEDFLKKNIDTLRKDTRNFIVLRRVWLEQNPDFKEYDMYLDLEWLGCWTQWHDECGPSCYPDGLHTPHAKDFCVRVLPAWEYVRAARVAEKAEKVVLR